MSGVRIVHFLKDWGKFIQINQYYMKKNKNHDVGDKQRSWPEFSTVDYLQINWLFKSVDYNKREISVIQRVQ